MYVTASWHGGTYDEGTSKVKTWGLVDEEQAQDKTSQLINIKGSSRNFHYVSRNLSPQSRREIILIII
jgi:hypothetical protein